MAIYHFGTNLGVGSKYLIRIQRRHSVWYLGRSVWYFGVCASRMISASNILVLQYTLRALFVLEKIMLTLFHTVIVVWFSERHQKYDGVVLDTEETLRVEANTVKIECQNYCSVVFIVAREGEAAFTNHWAEPPFHYAIGSIFQMGIDIVSTRLIQLQGRYLRI